VTPEQLSTAFDFIQREDGRVTSIRVAEAEFAPIAPRLDIFDRMTLGYGPAGMAWGVNVFYDSTVAMGQVLLEGTLGGPQEPNFVSFLFDLEPEVRVHIESVNPEAFAGLANGFTRKLKDLRDHVALDKHRSFTIEQGGSLAEGLDRRTFLTAWTISCYADLTRCRRSWVFSEDEIAAGGRPDLTDRFGWGAEIESAKLTAGRDRPIAWEKVGELLGDDE
jgi:hypothetical protein